LILPGTRHLRLRWRRPGSRRRRRPAAQLVEQAAALIEGLVSLRGWRRGRRRAGTDDGARLAFEPSQHRKQQAGGEKPHCQYGRGAGQHVRGAAAGEEPAAPAAHAEAAALRLLQKHDPDQGQHDHQMDNDKDRQH